MVPRVVGSSPDRRTISGCGGMVDTSVLETGAERRVGSSPTSPTNRKHLEYDALAFSERSW